jgi:DNA-binding beta-propeller fold protein YncE
MTVRWNNMTPSCTALRRALGFFTMIPALCLLSSCAADIPAASLRRPSITWPMASEKNRIVWVKNITGPGDVGIGNGFWRRMLDVVIGEENSIIVRPYGVLRTAAGQIYLADPGAGLVHCLDIVNGRYSVIGGQGGSPLRSPIGLAEDDTGRLYITDSITGMVYRFTPKTGSLKPLPSKAFERPTGIAFHPLNKFLYVADTKASQIVVLDQDGAERRRIGGRGDGNRGFNSPTDLTIDARGQIYVTDSLNFRIIVLTPEGQMVRQFGTAGDAQGYFGRPKGVALDSAGNIYVSDTLMDAVQVFDQNGELLLAFGRKGVGPGQFWLPSGLFIDRRDQIYVVDTYNRRIQVFRYLTNGVDENAGSEADLFDKPLPTP